MFILKGYGLGHLKGFDFFFHRPSCHDCHVITPSSLCDGWLHEWTSVAQLLRSRRPTALISSVPVSPVHIKMLPIQDIPQPHFPSARPSSSCPQYCPMAVSQWRL